MSNGLLPEEESGLVGSAVLFLKNPKVRNASERQKIAFLKSKGLTNKQICRAFQVVGIHIDPSTCAAVSPSDESCSSENQYNRSTTPISPRESTRTLFPEPSSSTTAPVSNVTPLDWRNVVIGVGAAALAGVGVTKLWNNYSPYELRRKGSSPQEALLSASPLLPVKEPIISRALPPLPTLPPQSSPTISPKVEELEEEISTLKAALEVAQKGMAEMCIKVSKIRAENNKLLHTNQQHERALAVAEAEMERLGKLKDRAEKIEADPVVPEGETSEADPVVPEGETSEADPVAPEGGASEADPVVPERGTSEDDPVAPEGGASKTALDEGKSSTLQSENLTTEFPFSLGNDAFVSPAPDFTNETITKEQFLNGILNRNAVASGGDTDDSPTIPPVVINIGDEKYVA